MVKCFRVIGLDPAGPLEDPLSDFVLGASHLTVADADVVWIVHTDKLGYGYALSTGTADFHVNGGIRIQPGCPLFSIPLTFAGK